MRLWWSRTRARMRRCRRSWIPRRRRSFASRCGRYGCGMGRRCCRCTCRVRGTQPYGRYLAPVSQMRKVGMLKQRKRKISENVIPETLLWGLSQLDETRQKTSRLHSRGLWKSGRFYDGERIWEAKLKKGGLSMCCYFEWCRVHFIGPWRSRNHTSKKEVIFGLANGIYTFSVRIARLKLA